MTAGDVSVSESQTPRDGPAGKAPTSGRAGSEPLRGVNRSAHLGSRRRSEQIVATRKAHRGEARCQHGGNRKALGLHSGALFTLRCWLARKDSNLRSPDPEDPRRFRRWSVRFECGADSDPVDPAGSQVEHAGRSQVNVIRSSDSGIDRIAPDDGWKGERFPLFPLLPRARHASPPSGHRQDMAT